MKQYYCTECHQVFDAENGRPIEHGIYLSFLLKDGGIEDAKFSCPGKMKPYDPLDWIKRNDDMG